MSIAESPKMTGEDLLSLPDDGVERWLINGELREGGMTRRNRKHARVEANVSYLMRAWEESSGTDGRSYSGEVRCYLQHNPDTTVGIDVAFFSGEVLAGQDDTTSMIDGPPVLAIEILSPSDTQEALTEKINAYLQHDVVVWIVNPDFKTITIHAPSAQPVSFNVTQQITGDSYLPGFAAPVAKIFN